MQAGTEHRVVYRSSRQPLRYRHSRLCASLAGPSRVSRLGARPMVLRTLRCDMPASLLHPCLTLHLSVWGLGFFGLGIRLFQPSALPLP